MKETYIKQAVEYAKELLAIPSPTGYTAEATKYLMKTLQDMGYNPIETTKGAVQVRLGGEGTDGLLLASHVDTLGAMVRAVKSSGRLRVSPIGGLNPSNTETETVWVRTHCGKLYEGTLQLENASVHVNAKLKETVRTWDNAEVVLDEPVKKLFNQGMVCHKAYRGRETKNWCYPWNIEEKNGKFYNTRNWFIRTFVWRITTK